MSNAFDIKVKSCNDQIDRCRYQLSNEEWLELLQQVYSDTEIKIDAAIALMEDADE